jgi:hypothetical protein
VGHVLCWENPSTSEDGSFIHLRRYVNMRVCVNADALRAAASHMSSVGAM